jgi:hypothetical protein
VRNGENILNKEVTKMNGKMNRLCFFSQFVGDPSPAVELNVGAAGRSSRCR